MATGSFIGSNAEPLKGDGLFEAFLEAQRPKADVVFPCARSIYYGHDAFKALYPNETMSGHTRSTTRTAMDLVKVFRASNPKRSLAFMLLREHRKRPLCPHDAFESVLRSSDAPAELHRIAQLIFYRYHAFRALYPAQWADWLDDDARWVDAAKTLVSTFEDDHPGCNLHYHTYFLTLGSGA